jgi:hypothetical protein
MALPGPKRGAEFQAVIMAGGSGTRLYPLTGEAPRAVATPTSQPLPRVCADDLPKALLPVANRPLLSYQLRLLESAGFQGAPLAAWRAVARSIPHGSARPGPARPRRRDRGHPADHAAVRPRCARRAPTPQPPMPTLARGG